MQRRTFLAAAACGAVGMAETDSELPDFSNCGFGGGGVALPSVPVRAELRPESGDATARIQAAIDALAALPLDRRGAILLRKGNYDVGGTVRVKASGIVLRGEDGSVVTGTGKGERSLIEIRGTDGGRTGAALKIVDELVPVGGRSFQVASAGGLRKGQLVVVRRNGNAAWIREIGMDRIRTRPGHESETKQWTPFSLDFERVITAVDGDRITVDAPVFCAIEKQWGGGEVLPLEDAGRRVERCGVENLRGVSEIDKSVTAVYGKEKETYLADEAHAKSFITLDNANDCWVRDVQALRFVFALVDLKRTRQVTVQDCFCGEMVSKIDGSRRYPYSVGGQRTLVERCKGDTGRHDFVVGARVAGPNVFLDCEAGRSFATSEPHHRWSVGGLYDNVKANIALQDRQYYGTGHGWSGANYVAWNCEGSLVCQNPPTAHNWAIGQVGQKEPGAFAPRADGVWISYGKHVTPRSLYLSQLGKRLGKG